MKPYATCLLLALTACLQAEPPRHLYVSAGGAVNSYAIDLNTGKLKEAHSVDLGAAGAFVFSQDSQRLYVLTKEGNTPQIATLSVGCEGEMELLNRADSTHPGGYFTRDRSGKFLAGNNYRGGLVSVWELEEGIYKGKAPQSIELEPRAHGANFSADNRWLLVPATAPNKVFVCTFDPRTGKIAPHDPPFANGPEEPLKTRHPRHLLFHPELPVAYTTCESQEPGVAVWNWNQGKGTLSIIEDFVTQPVETEAKTSTSTLHLTPDARFLYVAFRNKENSSIAGFQVHPKTGRLNYLGHTPCEIVPRSFCIDLEGRFLYVAGQVDNKIGTYAIHPQSGQLTKVQQIEVPKGPRWVRVR